VVAAGIGVKISDANLHTGEMPLIVVLLIAVPIVELWVIVQVAGEIGVLNTIGVLLAVSVLGAWLLKQQGLATWARLQATLASGEMPAKEITDGALILFGGALLLTPGFVTDVVGLLLLFPPTRAIVKRFFRRVLASWARRRYVPPGSFVYETTVVRERSTPTERPSGPGPRPRGEDGSLDKG
jgi:UPF0716 protein FxsA